MTIENYLENNICNNQKNNKIKEILKSLTKGERFIELQNNKKNESNNERKLQIEDQQKNNLEEMFLQNYNCKEIESEKLKIIIKKLLNEIIKEENLRFNI